MVKSTLSKGVLNDGRKATNDFPCTVEKLFVVVTVVEWEFVLVVYFVHEKNQTPSTKFVRVEQTFMGFHIFESFRYSSFRGEICYTLAYVLSSVILVSHLVSE